MVARSIHAMILYVVYVCDGHVSGKIASGVAVRGDSGVAGEGRVVGIPKFYSWSKCTMPLTNINSDWISNASSGLCIIMAYGSNSICRDGPEKNGGHIKSAQMTRSKCLRWISQRPL